MAQTYSEEIHRKAKIMWLSGNYKSDKEIARVLGIKRSVTICDWRKAENWEAERAATVKEVQRKVDSVLTETMAEMQRRHLREYQAMQTKGVQALVKAEPRTVGDAVNLLDTGIKGERLVKGEPTEIREIRGVMQFNLEIVETIVADIVKEFLRDRRLKREDARLFAEEFAGRISRAPFRFEMPAAPAAS